MTERSDDNNSKHLQRYDHNPFYDDYVASRELLETIQGQNREALDRSEFTTRFIDALKDVPYLAPDAQIVVRQYFNENPDGKVRVIVAALRQMSQEGKSEQFTREVGSEYSDMQFPTLPFTAEDLELAIGQLDDLQTMKTLGMLSIDNSLSYPQFRSLRLFRP